jgi:hypothetical protein
MLNIMDLEQQLINEIEERQAKLDKVRGVSPKLQQLEALLNECQSVCNEFGMQDLFISLVENFTGTIQATPTPQPQPQPQNNQNNNAVLTDKEIKVIRLELKTFLEYDGQRLNDKTAKELLIKKLEELGKQELLSEVNLDDKDNFLTESKKLINLLTLAKEETLTVAKEETLTVAKEETLTVAKEETLTVAKEETLTVAKEETLTVAKEEIREVEGLSGKDVIKSTLVQNSITGFYGTVERDGVLNGGALVRYPNTTELTPLSNLKLISPAVITPTPKVEEEIKEEEGVSDMTPQELGMWDALLAADFTAAELSAMATDKDTLDGFNSINGTSLTALPIAELYEYTMGVGRIE